MPSLEQNAKLTFESVSMLRPKAGLTAAARQSTTRAPARSLCLASAPGKNGNVVAKFAARSRAKSPAENHCAAPTGTSAQGPPASLSATTRARTCRPLSGHFAPPSLSHPWHRRPEAHARTPSHSERLPRSALDGRTLLLQSLSPINQEQLTKNRAAPRAQYHARRSQRICRRPIPRRILSRTKKGG